MTLREDIESRIIAHKDNVRLVGLDIFRCAQQVEEYAREIQAGKEQFNNLLSSTEKIIELARMKSEMKGRIAILENILNCDE